jgi:hypothetical protein
MFGFLKKKKDQDKLGSGEPIITALLMEGDSFPADAFLKELAKTPIAGQAASDLKNEGQVFSFSVGDDFFALSLMPAPYPASDIEGPIATTWLWPNDPPREHLRQHKTFLLTTMTGGAGDRIRRRWTMTAVTALAAQQPGVMGVLWPEATLVIFPKLFIEMAAAIDSPEAPPLYLWVDLRAFRNPDGTTGLFTHGLAALGHMEMEIPSIDMPIGELREWMLNIMYYLLEKGPVLKDGQTIGMSAEQQINIRHTKSSFGHPGKVIRLEP